MSALVENYKEPKTALAFIVIIFAIISIILMSIIYLCIVDSTKKSEAAQMVFNSTLPLFGTWVGTILAYYFAKENFDSATKNTLALSQVSLPNQANGLESILVSATISDRFLFEKNLNQSLEKVKENLIKSDRKRLPILNQETHALVFLAYYEDLDAFNTSNPGKILSDFIRASPDKNKPVVFVGKDASLAKANEARKKVADCRDIFVTENGSKDGKIIGYLTDFDVDRYSKV